jgi:hypothetical protein
LVACLLAAACASAPVVCADETEVQRLERLQAMSDAEKAAILGKKSRYDELGPAGQQRLRTLQDAISRDPDAKQLEETITRYNKWLANLSSPQRGAILAIADPTERIKKIKELMQKQEEDRFRLFVQEEVTRADLDTIHAWLGEFVQKNEAQITPRLRHEWQRHLESLTDEAVRRRTLVTYWQFSRRDPEMTSPSKEDFDQLLGKLSEDFRKRINAVAKAEDRDRRLSELVFGAIVSRAAQPSRDELQKFYASMPADDTRRERLEGLERDDLYRVLQQMYNEERWGRRGRGGGGFRGGRGGPGGPDGPSFGGGPPPGIGGPPPQRGDRPEPPDGGKGGQFKGPPPEKRGEKGPPPPMP